jgi:hypothetical protein
MLAGAVALYAIMHSPLRELIAASVGRATQACYFICVDEVSFGGLANSLAAWTLLGVALMAAWVIADQVMVPYERPLAFGLAALGFVAGPAAAIGEIASWSRTEMLRPPLGPLLAGLPAVLVLGVGLLRGWRPVPRLVLGHQSRLVVLVSGLAGALFLASAGLSLFHPTTGYDALSYHGPLAVFLWRDGNLTTFLDRAPVVDTLANPGSTQLWYGLLLLAGGERLADLGQAPFALLGCAAIGAFTRRLGLGRGAARLAGAAYLLAPMVVMLVGMQVTDVAGAGLLMATFGLAAAPFADWTTLRLALIGLGLGLVATTKLALLPGVAGVMLFVAGGTIRLARSGQRSGYVAGGVCLAGALFLSLVAPWWLRNVYRYGNPVFPAGLPLIGRGIVLSRDYPRIDHEFVPTPAAWPLYPLLEAHSERSGLGALFVVGAVVGSVIAVRQGRRQPLLLYLVTALVMLPAWWTLTNHDPRFLLTLFGLGFAFVPWSLLAVPPQRRWAAAALLGAAAVFSAAVTAEQALLPLARQPTDRLEFYDRVWGVDPAVAALPEREGILLHTGYASYSYPAFYPLLGRSHRRVVVPIDTDTPPDSILAVMQRAGVRYAYVITSPASRALVESLYDRSRFELASSSIVQEGWRKGTQRLLYRLK